MCNAHNHRAGCTCGFGGEGHLGKSPGGFSTGRRTSVTVPLRSSWPYRGEDFCQPTRCPHCGAAVYFVRHNGGSVWFDDLGWPWPKHGCFDDDRFGIELRRAVPVRPSVAAAPLFGVIIEATATRPGRGGRIIVRCSDGKLLDQEFNTNVDLSSIVGALVIVVRNELGIVTSLRFVDASLGSIYSAAV